jgi:nicotinate-nucleotide adenylyltransferase
MIDFEVRLNWLESIAQQVQPQCCAQIRASRVEQVVARGVEGPIYSYTLLAHLADSLALDGKEIALVVGQDVADLLPTFYRGEELLERFSIVCVEEKIHVRSTVVRERLALGEPLPTHWMAPGMNPVNYDLYATHGN